MQHDLMNNNLEMLIRHFKELSYSSQTEEITLELRQEKINNMSLELLLFKIKITC